MTAALIAVVAIAVGLPLLAWWVGGRRFWSRLRPGAEPDPWGEAVRRFHLTPQEAAQVEFAVNWGRRLEDARLRPAAVAWAQQRIEQERSRSRVRSPWARGALVACWLTAVGAGLAWLTVTDGSFPWSAAVWWVLWPVAVAWVLRGPRRALRLNGDPPGRAPRAPSRGVSSR